MSGNRKEVIIEFGGVIEGGIVAPNWVDGGIGSDGISIVVGIECGLKP